MGVTPTAEQQGIIIDTEGYIRCISVPGSGKTFCITNRMAYLIRNLRVDPSAIVALTFTNKAARSMTHRLKQLIGDEATCFTGTFHGYCYKILKEEIYHLSWPKTFTIADQKAQIDMITEIATELHLSLKDYPAKNYMEDILRAKEGCTYIPDLIGPDKSSLVGLVNAATTDFQRIYSRYLLKQRDNFILDFFDMIAFVLYIFDKHNDVLDKWQDKCMYLLCDEYQDVNMHQEILLKKLCGKYMNLTVVGDDDQCIYGWRGSKVGYIVDFHAHYHPVKDHYLTENFRSAPEIIAVANSLIKANQHRLPKTMVTNNPSGPKPVYNNTHTEKDEASWIAQTINDAVSQGNQYSNHAVLVRASSQTRALEEAFVRAKIPYKILSGAKFYDSEAIRTTLAYLRIVYAMNDLDFTYTINRPKRGYGKKSVEKLRTYAEQMNLTLMEALGAQISSGIEKRQAVIDYYNGIIKLHNTYQNYSSVDIANMALDIGYREAIQNDVDQTKVDNVSELLDTIAALEEENQENIPLSDLLAHFALFEKADDDTDKDVVKIMTVHTAKGLEFDTVFVNGLVQGQFPSKQLRNQDELEEERRLFYVAITRAKSLLYLSSYDEKVENYPAEQSCFLKDIDESLLNCINNSKIQGPYLTPPMRSKSQFAVGDMVIHVAFGQGIVVGIDERNQTYEIKFDSLMQTRRIQFRASTDVLTMPTDISPIPIS